MSPTMSTLLATALLSLATYTTSATALPYYNDEVDSWYHSQTAEGKYSTASKYFDCTTEYGIDPKSSSPDTTYFHYVAKRDVNEEFTAANGPDSYVWLCVPKPAPGAGYNPVLALPTFCSSDPSGQTSHPLGSRDTGLPGDLRITNGNACSSDPAHGFAGLDIRLTQVTEAGMQIVQDVSYTGNLAGPTVCSDMGVGKGLTCSIYLTPGAFDGVGG